MNGYNNGFGDGFVLGLAGGSGSGGEPGAEIDGDYLVFPAEWIEDIDDDGYIIFKAEFADAVSEYIEFKAPVEGIKLINLSATANGSYTAPEGKAYKRVAVEVQPSYSVENRMLILSTGRVEDGVLIL